MDELEIETVIPPALKNALSSGLMEMVTEQGELVLVAQGGFVIRDPDPVL
jgi:hypothetical protein